MNKEELYKQFDELLFNYWVSVVAYCNPNNPEELKAYKEECNKAKQRLKNFFRNVLEQTN